MLLTVACLPSFSSLYSQLMRWYHPNAAAKLSTDSLASVFEDSSLRDPTVQQQFTIHPGRPFKPLLACRMEFDGEHSFLLCRSLRASLLVFFRFEKNLIGWISNATLILANGLD